MFLVCRYVFGILVCSWMWKTCAFECFCILAFKVRRILYPSDIWVFRRAPHHHADQSGKITPPQVPKFPALKLMPYPMSNGTPPASLCAPLPPPPFPSAASSSWSPVVILAPPAPCAPPRWVSKMKCSHNHAGRLVGPRMRRDAWRVLPR
jgi:hypothetical protein